MKKYIFLVCMVLLSAAGSAAREPMQSDLIDRETLASAAGMQETRYPDADMLLVDDRTAIRYETDGSSRFVSDMAFKILTEKGRQDQSAIRIGYDAAYGTTRFFRADLVKPDGRLIPIDLNRQVREAIHQGQMDANIYDPNHKTVQLTVPDLEIGDVLRYTVTGEQTKAVVPGSWSDLFTLEEPFPVRHAVYTVDAPAERPLTRIELKDEIPGTVVFQTLEKDGRILYTWDVQNVPQMFSEPGMPARHTVVQRLLLSTLPDWETLSRWYWELSRPRLNSTTPAMKLKVRELIAGESDRQKQIEALFRFVSQDVRYMGITVEDEAPGYEPHDVSLTFNNRYGVCRDKAALLVAMLRLAGFDARPVLIYVGPKKDPEVPQPWFNHAITAVRNEDGSWQLMDATNENTRDLLPAYLCDRSYLVATPDGETLQTSPVIPPEQNLLTITIDAALEDGALIAGEAHMQFDGINDTAYRGRLAGLKPEERRPYFEERLKQAFGSARLLRLDIQPEDVRDTTVPLSATLRFEIDNALAAGPEESVLQIPTLINHFGLFGRLLGDGIGLDERRYPLHVQITCGVAETVRLDLSKSGLEAAVLPTYETIDTPELFIRRAVAASNEVLISRADILLRTVEFSPEQYLALKQNLKTSERNARKRVLLTESDTPAGADLAILSENVVYTLYDEHNWKETRTVRQKVLTYAGKREASDLKITFNPALQRVHLEDAVVTAPDGSVTSIDPAKEINIMDAKSAGEAPRYPPEKILVASLPAVEIGSIIETRVTSVFHDMPFFSASEFFAGHAPLFEKSVELQAPHSFDLDMGNMAPDVIRRRTGHRDRTVRYEWTGGRQPLIKKEDHLPPDWIIRPALFLSSGNMKDYAKDAGKILRKAAGKDKLAAAKARELTREIKSRREKIIVLRDYVAKTIREAGPAFSALPLSAVTPADRILAEGYGNTADRAVLLYAMLDAVKLKPRFLLSSNLPQVQDAAAAVMATFQRAPFDTVLVAVDGDKKETLYLGDSGQYAALGTLVHNRQPALDLHSGELEIPQTALPDATETSFLMQIAETGDVQLTRREALTGTHFEQFHKKFAQFTPEERRREHQSLLSRLSQFAEAVGPLQSSFKQPGLLQFNAALPGYAVREENRLYLTLPEGLGNVLQLQSSRRETPFYIEKPIHKAFLYEIALPKGWEPLLMPEAFRMELPANAGFVEVKTARIPGGLAVLQLAQINAAIIPAEEYDTLLDLNNRLTAPSASTLLLRKIADNQ